MDPIDNASYGYIFERMPRRAKWLFWAYGTGTVGVVCFMTLILFPIAIILIPLAFYCIWKQFRYPVYKVMCPNCKRKLQVEVEVKKFHCVCHTLLKREGDEEIAKEI
ncbi:hypothetical protein IC620_09090 [Hazenella sp. IB182357]|uniref:Uncharacterized protein n=1 Tax=Polycladospora coralii TaxID=2771432 RepID=A0A926RUL4_9BACL|nr:hypothetical protein [Polycladospora coralii]MBD1372509.1 hypothetical protein [Polycladospora coralii]